MIQQSITHHAHDSGWIDSQFAQLPEGYHQHISREYSHLYRNAGSHEGEKRRNANLFLLNLTEQAGKRVFTLSDDEIKRKAERLSLECRRQMKLAGSRAVIVGRAFFESAGFNPAELLGFDATGTAARLGDAEFWKRKLTRRQDREQEAFAIGLGVVRKGRGLYVSDAMFQTISNRHAASIRALAALEAVNEETGETVDMLTVLKGSVANPEVRRVELMVRMRGFEEAAKKAGHVGMFYTLTCPSKYHRFTSDKDTGKPADNPNYNGATPRQAQTYLTGLWARIRAQFKRDGLTAYGFRVAEPHHDGCPHWHMLVFTDSAHQEAVTGVMRDHALRVDGDEPGADKYRFKAVKIDASKGSATGYIAKYVSKNINGYGVDEDFEGSADAQDSAQRVRAWASLWGIRQFQQIGGAPVGVWRELRRLKEAPEGLLEEARKAADAGDWGAYMELQGGVSAMRKEMPLKVYTVERVNTETGEVISNKYGEIVAKVEGVALEQLLITGLVAGVVKTRLHTWRIQDKKRASSSTGAAGSSPWSTVNNCTQAHGREVSP